jgi:protoporphyrinogen oxidase
MNMYDVVIIGAGISGLYSAYKIQNINPTIKVIILEEQSEKYMGGRTGNEIFEGVKIVNGADVGRIGKDNVLLNLLHTFNIKYKINIGSEVDPGKIR